MVKKIRLDFSKVEERAGYNTKRMPEGLHEFKVVEVVDKEAQDGTPMWVFALVPTAAKYKTRRFPYYCKLQQNQLWKLRDLFIAAGIPVPKKAQQIDPNKVIGKTVAGEVVDASGQYEGRSELDGIYELSVLEDLDEMPEDDDEDEGEDEEWEDDSDDEPEDDEEEEDEEEDLETLTLPELRKLAKSLGIDTAGLKKADLIESIEEEQAGDEDDDDDLDDEDLEDEDDEELFEDDEDEEEEEAPAPRRRASKPAAKAPAKAAPKRTVRRR